MTRRYCRDCGRFEFRQAVESEQPSPMSEVGWGFIVFVVVIAAVVGVLLWAGTRWA